MKKILFILLFSLQVFAQIQETPDLASCLALAKQDTKQLNQADVVYIFDIDNTALKLKNNFGSVQWYRWQQKAIADKTDERIADTIDELLAAQAHIYQLSGTVTPESTTATELGELQKQGYPVMFHTSRNNDTRDLTTRELTANGLLPLTRTLGPDKGFAGTFLFAKATEPQRPVTFQNGIYMSAGQDKGIWLGLLFEKLNYQPKHIVFVDDELKNLTNVERALKSQVPLTLCRYGAVDEMVKAFNSSDKSAEKNLWKDFESLVKKLK